MTIVITNAPAKTDQQDPSSPGFPRPGTIRRWRRSEVPLADASASPVPVSADYYYRIPVRPIYKTYPVYHPSKEPSGYFERLKGVEPEVVRLRFLERQDARTTGSGVGEIVFDTPTDYDISGSPAQFRDPSYYAALGIPVASDGTVPFVKYVIREKGKVEVGVLACGTCHTRVMPDGAVVKGAQGNFPFDRTAPPELPDEALPVIRRLVQDAVWRALAGRAGSGAPVRDDGVPMPWSNMAGRFRQAFRRGTARGCRSRRRFPISLVCRTDATSITLGLVRHRGIADLMRYAALNQAVDLYSRHGDFVPVADDYRTVPDPYTRLALSVCQRAIQR